MSWAEVSTLNGDFLNAPLDIRMHLADYKMYGEDSYVFQQKELLHGLYECTYLSMNDRRINGETLEYFLKNNKHIGEALIAIFDLGRKDIIKTLRTMQAVVSSSTAMQAVASSSTAMQAVASSSTAIAYICKIGYNATKAIIKAINNDEGCIKKVFDTVTSNSSKFQLTVTQEQDGVASLNQFCNTPDTIILCALGAFRAGASTNLLINNELIKSSGSGGLQPHYVDRNNCSAIAVPTATFTENGDGYAAIAVYKAI